ncbi:MAG: pantetheine-phosphate adenylyltransferase [Pedobacter sp.]|nr:pantetheine-phosphate adenylyltransferase [Pedobacter sp.]
MKIAIFPGSFDPITIAHADILKRALPLFDKIIVGIGLNSAKQGYFNPEKRKDVVEAVFAGIDKVEVQLYEGLTVDFCKRNDAKFIVRGVRSVGDFEYEKPIAQINQTLMPEVETILFFSKPEYGAISSTIVRDILKHGGDVSKFLPAEAMPFIK